ncbi:recombinase family protein [Herminiimonas arsenitoxidans]|uniref:recombinase family protein n=1 Tax=Herminiimonas arsenitoxidans TaxID=1809410 RepID=UPI0009704ECE|nr:recombinase family protein [Herminiimonas arsenitoxidans]
MTIAYSYVRFSRAEQLKGDSLRRQIELSEQYAQEHNLTLDQSFRLHDLGVSAFDGSNLRKGALGGFLNAVESGRIARGSILLVESLDRLSREQVLYALEVFTSIMRKGITIVTLADGMEYNEDSIANNYSNLVMSIMIMARAHEESLTKSKRIKSAWQNKRNKIAEKKLTAQCPRWLALSADKTTFTFIPERVAIIKEIINWSLNGIGQALIAKRLNERKEKHFSNHGNGWHTSYICKILNSPALHGEFQPHLWIDGKNQPHGDSIQNYFPALMSKEEFLVMKNTRELRLFGRTGKRGVDVPNLLSGLVKCGYCGSSMVLAGATAKRSIGPDGVTSVRLSKKVLVCDEARRGLGCYAVRWDYKDLEKSFLSFCRGLELQQLLDDLDKNTDAEDKVRTLQDELQLTDAEIQESNRKVGNLLLALESGHTAPDALIERMKVLESSIASANLRKVELQTQIKALALAEKNDSRELQSVQDVINRLEEKTGDELFLLRAALADKIRRLFKEVRVHPAGKLTSPEELKTMREQLTKVGYDAKRIADYLQDYRTEPKRVGTARYASRRDIGRYFVIQARKEGVRVIYPDFDDPSKVTVELSS